MTVEPWLAFDVHRSIFGDINVLVHASALVTLTVTPYAGTLAVSKDARAERDEYGFGARAVRPWMRFRFDDRPEWWWAVELDSKPAFKCLAALDDYNAFVGPPKAVRCQRIACLLFWFNCFASYCSIDGISTVVVQWRCGLRVLRCAELCAAVACTVNGSEISREVSCKPR